MFWYSLSKFLKNCLGRFYPDYKLNFQIFLWPYKPFFDFQPAKKWWEASSYVTAIAWVLITESLLYFENYISSATRENLRITYLALLQSNRPLSFKLSVSLLISIPFSVLCLQYKISDRFAQWPRRHLKIPVKLAHSDGLLQLYFFSTSSLGCKIASKAD